MKNLQFRHGFVASALKILGALLLLSSLLGTIGCNSVAGSGSDNASAQKAFDACVGRLMAQYGYESHACHQVRSHYIQSLTEYVSGPMTGPSISSYFNGYLPQFPPEQVSILIDSWNRL